MDDIAALGPGTLVRLAAEAGFTDPSIVLASAAGSQAIGIEPERALYPASMIKVPIALALMLRCEDGTLSLGERRPIGAGNMTTTDAPSALVPGYVATLGELLREMIRTSDNVATNELIDVLGRDTIGPACKPFGAHATAVRRKLSGSSPLIDDPGATGRNTHPAADNARLLQEILARNDRTGDDPIYAALEAQYWNDKLSRGLRPGDRFAHKTGDTDDTSHDGGILTLEDGRRYVLVVYTGLAATPETDKSFGMFARALRPYLDR